MSTKRRRKSSITRLPTEQREYIERLLRAGQMTLDEMIDDLKARFVGQPAADVSRSALHRFDQYVAETTQEIREIEAAASAIAGTLGEGFGEKSADFLAQAITVLALKATKRAKDDGDLSTKEAKDLALMAKNAMDTRRMSLNTRRIVAQEAREEALRESRARVEALGKTGAIDPDALALVMKTAYDL